jgi:hypothetical protein
MTRRDFFARVTGRNLPQESGRPSSGAPQHATAQGEKTLHTFHVAEFEYHDGPVLVPTLKPGMEFALVPQSDHPTNPDAVRVERDKDHFGYVPPALSKEVRHRLQRGDKLLCRVARVNPTAELGRVLTVELVLSDKRD